MLTVKRYRRGDNSVRPVVFLSVVLVSLGFAWWQASARAQQPDGSGRELPVDEAAKVLRLRVLQILQRGTFGPGDQEVADQKVFDRYYKRYKLCLWSLEKYHTSLPDFRKELRNHLRTAGTGNKPTTVHDYLNTMVLRFMSGYATRGEFHAAVRVNAMLMIGELNSKEAARTPVPLPDALPVMLATLDDAKPPDAPRQPDPIQVAALLGIIRHAKLGIGERPIHARVEGAMYKLATTKSVPGRSADGHAWMRAQAAEVLGELGMVGNNGSVAKAMVEMVADSKLPFSTRCAAARAMGELDYRGSAGLDPRELASRLGQLVVDACGEEGLRGEPISRRRLKSRLSAAFDGLNAIESLANGTPHQGFAADLVTGTKAILTVLDNRSLDDYEMADQIDEECRELANLIETNAKAGEEVSNADSAAPKP